MLDMDAGDKALSMNSQRWNNNAVFDCKSQDSGQNEIMTGLNVTCKWTQHIYQLSSLHTQKYQPNVPQFEICHSRSEGWLGVL